MYLVRLLYVSKVSNGFSKNDLQSILAKASEHNQSKGITGMLAFNGDYFLQVLEGGRGAVNQLYQRIITDSRHEHLLLLQLSEITERLFAGWAMAYVPTALLTRDLLLRFGSDAQFRPLQMSAQSCIGLLQSFRDRLPAA